MLPMIVLTLPEEPMCLISMQGTIDYNINAATLARPQQAFHGKQTLGRHQVVRMYSNMVSGDPCYAMYFGLSVRREGCICVPEGIL